MSTPNHIAIIMDGNGRWAKKRGHSRVFGHVRGMKTVRSSIEACVSLNIPQLTLFALSNENWSRPKLEVTSLMKILRKFLLSERKFLIKNNIKLTTIGDETKLPLDIQKLLAETKVITSSNSGLKLCLAISYGSQQEIFEAAKCFAFKIKTGELNIDSCKIEDFENSFPGGGLDHPDLIIRTSGETRLSNFLLYQAAYAEIYFTNVLWPDFSRNNLEESILWYENRERRFGKTSEQLISKIGDNNELITN